MNDDCLFRQFNTFAKILAVPYGFKVETSRDSFDGTNIFFISITHCASSYAVVYDDSTLEMHNDTKSACIYNCRNSLQISDGLENDLDEYFTSFLLSMYVDVACQIKNAELYLDA